MKKKSTRADRLTTSISIDRSLYRDLGVDLRERGRNYGEWFDEMIRHYLTTKDIAEMQQSTTAEQEVCDALRKLVQRERTLMVTLPPLLGITESTLKKFVDKR